MKMRIPPPIDPAIASRIAELFRSGAAQDDILLAMRCAGLSQIDSVKLLRSHGGVTLAEAKKIVHMSVAWQDRLSWTDELHDAAVEAFAELERAPVSSDKYEFAGDHGSQG